MTPITILSIDDHPLIRQGIRGLLAAEEDMQLVAEGSYGDEILPLAQRYRPQVLLLDLGLPLRTPAVGSTSGAHYPIVPVLYRLKEEVPETRTLILSQYSTPALVSAAQEAGVAGYLSKGETLGQELIRVIRLVAAGKRVHSPPVLAQMAQDLPRLRRRQMEILSLMVADPEISREEIAKQLHISLHTVRHHFKIIYQTLGVSSEGAALLRAMELGLLPQSESGPQVP